MITIFLAAILGLLTFAIVGLPYNGIFLLLLITAGVTAPALTKHIDWKA